MNSADETVKPQAQGKMLPSSEVVLLCLTPPSKHALCCLFSRGDVVGRTIDVRGILSQTLV